MSALGFVQPENAVSIIKGTSRTYEIVVQDENCKPVDLTGSTMYFTVKSHATDVAQLFQKISTDPLQILFTDALGGIARVYVNPADTFNASVKPYLFDVWLVLSTGKRYVVIPTSTFVVQTSVTVIPL